MTQTLGTLTSLAVYVALVAVGAVLGSRPGLRTRPLKFLGPLQTAALLILITALGVNLGANEEVIDSLGTIGLSALVLTVAAMAGSVLCVWVLRRFLLKMDRWGRTPAEQAAAEGETEAAGKGRTAGGSTLTWLIVLAVAAGMLAGYFLLPEAVTRHCGTVIEFGLYLLLLLVGVDMGRQGNAIAGIRAAGPRVLLVPLAVVVGTLGAAALAGLVLPLGGKDAAAATAGFGWYSLAPTLLASYSLTVSAVAFLSNVLREVLAIVCIPPVARYIGYVEAISLAGATAMDTTLPIVVGATSERMAIYSFASGVILSLLVPVLVPALAAL